MAMAYGLCLLNYLDLDYFAQEKRYKVKGIGYLGISYLKYIHQTKEDIRRLLEVPYLGIIPQGI